ncbi:hypothetical protein AB0K27_16405 [Micromonospora echinospora]|uniref:Nuclear transport factor 2 family protein n=1 Tax=Micromonospora echinospora TaxID=1877 RepID=A0ABR6MIS4_MICEC|nr:hypothetical protein [Micromonospora echinospora]MBB5115292.1 hypothetical protein [Micromonospora echinospora]
MGRSHRGRFAALALALALTPAALAACGSGDKGAATAPSGRAPAEEAAAKSRERVQAYLDALTARDADAGRSQLCAPMHAAFDAAATGPNGDFADHFTVPDATITDVRSGPNGQEVSASVTVAAGSRKATRSLLFTVTRNGADWCISGEAPRDRTAEPTADPSGPPPPAAPSPVSSQ